MDPRPAVRRRPCHRRHRRPGDRQRTASMSASAEEEQMEIDTLEAAKLGGITQRIRVRGADASNPVLLLMQQGPGLPIINDARRLERLLGLEKAFTVVYWDQRGTGLSSPSLRKDPNRFEISVTRMVDDKVALLELLRDRFGGKTFVAGFSFGATFAAYAATQRPELVAALVAAGMDIDMPGQVPGAADERQGQPARPHLKLVLSRPAEALSCRLGHCRQRRQHGPPP